MTVTITTLEAKNYGSVGVPPPPTPMRPYLYFFNGLEFGAGTKYVVESVDGLIGYSASADSVRSGTGPGSIPGLLTADPKVLTFLIKVDSIKGSEVEDVVTTLQKAFTIPPRTLNTWVGDFASRGYFTTNQTWLRFMRAGWTQPRVFYCRVTKFNIQSNYDLANGYVVCDVELTAEDPRAYGYHTNIISIPAGESYNWTQDGSYLDGYSPYVVIDGPLANPSVEVTYYNFYSPPPNGTTQRVTFNLSSPNNMQIDMANRLVDPMGASLVMSNRKFWNVLPKSELVDGYQTLRYNNGNSSSVADFYTRECWL